DISIKNGETTKRFIRDNNYQNNSPQEGKWNFDCCLSLELLDA
ncbi:12731_t:CDS:1, partial [Funneliformis caledonium]